MAMGSRRTTPPLPLAAAVVSLAMVAPTKTPCCQPKDSYTSGATRARRPPKMNAEMGTPSGASHFGEMEGDCRAGTVYRALGCAAGPLEVSHFSFFQLTSPTGGGLPMPSHQGSRSDVIATFVKIVFLCSAPMTLGLVSMPVPGATPKKPASGLMAWR